MRTQQPTALQTAKDNALEALREWAEVNPYEREWNWLTTEQMNKINERQAAWEKVQAALEVLKAEEGK